MYSVNPDSLSLILYLTLIHMQNSQNLLIGGAGQLFIYTTMLRAI